MCHPWACGLVGFVKHWQTTPSSNLSNKDDKCVSTSPRCLQYLKPWKNGEWRIAPPGRRKVQAASGCIILKFWGETPSSTWWDVDLMILTEHIWCLSQVSTRQWSEVKIYFSGLKRDLVTMLHIKYRYDYLTMCVSHLETLIFNPSSSQIKNKLKYIYISFHSYRGNDNNFIWKKRKYTHV